MAGHRIVEFARKSTMRIAGLMSGTSADGVDTAIVDISGNDVRVLAFQTYPYTSQRRIRIFALCDPETSRVNDICHMNFVLGEIFAQALLALCKKSGISPDSIDLIGSHGQTIYHNPTGRRFTGRKIRSTLQIGEPSVIAQRTGITTVADFRPRDIAAGGQGAPLVPYADFFLFQNKRISRAVQNIGGIANVTFLPAGGKIDDVIAFDTGPGNMIIDRIIQLATGGKTKYDRNGRRAAKGSVNSALLKKLLKKPFYRRRPPKTTGREAFGACFADELYKNEQAKGLWTDDLLATATALTATTIADAYRRHLPAMPDEMILCGGGAKNATLVKMLHRQLAGVKILRTDDFGVDCDAKEAVSFAILAHATIKGMAGNVPSATGASEPVILGKIIPA